MGTNYYAINQETNKELHIGKSSAGWCFGLHIIPEEHLNSLDDWVQMLETGNWTITNEYGESLSIEQLKEIITQRERKESLEKTFKPDFYSKSLHQFLKQNFAIIGPNNLLRSKIDGEHCVGHGEGTWDLIGGDFS